MAAEIKHAVGDIGAAPVGQPVPVMQPALQVPCHSDMRAAAVGAVHVCGVAVAVPEAAVVPEPDAVVVPEPAPDAPEAVVVPEPAPDAPEALVVPEPAPDAPEAVVAPEPAPDAPWPAVPEAAPDAEPVAVVVVPELVVPVAVVIDPVEDVPLVGVLVEPLLLPETELVPLPEVAELVPEVAPGAGVPPLEQAPARLAAPSVAIAEIPRRSLI